VHPTVCGETRSVTVINKPRGAKKGTMNNEQREIEEICERIIEEYFFYTCSEGSAKAFSEKIKGEREKEVEELRKRKLLFDQIRSGNLEDALNYCKKAFPFLLTTTDSEEKKAIEVLGEYIFTEYVRRGDYGMAISLAKDFFKNNLAEFGTDVFSCIGYREKYKSKVLGLKSVDEVCDEINQIIYNKENKRRYSLLHLTYLHWSSVVVFLDEEFNTK
jgi:hypothetical protein